MEWYYDITIGVYFFGELSCIPKRLQAKQEEKSSLNTTEYLGVLIYIS